MRLADSRSTALLCALSLSLGALHAQTASRRPTHPEPAAQPPALAIPLLPGAITRAEPLPNGIRLTTANGCLEEITALRDDVLRIRIAHAPRLPEDASWAVLPEARHASARVTPLESAPRTAATVGFRTASLDLRISRADSRLELRDRAGTLLSQDAAPVRFDGSAFRLVKSMPPDEHYFGLGDKTGPLDRRNRAFTLWNTDAYRFQESTDPLYKSIPFFFTYRAGVAVGTLLDNTWRSSFDFGKDSPTEYTFGAVDGPVDLYLFLGPSPREVVATYAWLTGRPPLPPRWTLGFQQSRYSYTPESRLLEVARRLRADRIPADALYLDIDFQDRNRPFTVDTKAFPDLAGTLATLKAMHFHTIAITDLHVAKAPAQGYTPYDTGLAGDEFLHNPDGSVYTGAVWPGPAVFPDFTRASSRDWWGRQYTNFAKMGFAGFWNDMNEPSIFDSPTATMPLTTVHRIREPGRPARSATHAELHNVYGMENARATYEGLRVLDPNTRPFVLTRASYAGGQRYAATWTGDNSSTWNHLRLTGPMLKNLGLSGFSFAGADVGGFAGSATPDLLTKWLEVAAFHPIDRDHSEKGTLDQEPWELNPRTPGGPDHEAIRRRYIEQRYRLMPYLYTLAEETARTGLPMMRPLFLDYPDATADRHPIDLDPGTEAEFLLGHDLLIAPSPYPEAPDPYTVEFPSAAWYDLWTGKPVPPRPREKATESNAPAPASAQLALYTSVTPTLETLPVYVRGGAILPLAPLVQSTGETPVGPLTLRIYAGDSCRGSLYTDDGDNFTYTRGNYLRQTFTCTVTPEALRVTLSAREGSYTPWWKEIRIEVYGWTPTRNTIRQDGHDTSLVMDKDGAAVGLSLPDTGKRTTLELQ